MAATKALTRARPGAKFRTESIDEFRAWLRNRIEHDPRSLNAIEAEANMRGNALGKFIRGERGDGMSLTPLQIKRLAPVLGISEETLLVHAGHLTTMPDMLSVEQAVLADADLDYDQKRFMIDFYRRMTGRGSV